VVYQRSRGFDTRAILWECASGFPALKSGFDRPGAAGERCGGCVAADERGVGPPATAGIGVSTGGRGARTRISRMRRRRCRNVLAVGAASDASRQVVFGNSSVYFWNRAGPELDGAADVHRRIQRGGGHERGRPGGPRAGEQQLGKCDQRERSRIPSVATMCLRRAKRRGRGTFWERAGERVRRECPGHGALLTTRCWCCRSLDGAWAGREPDAVQLSREFL